MHSEQTQHIPRLIKPKQVSKTANIPYTSIRAAAFRGELAVCRIGRAWFLYYDEVQRWIESRTERHRPAA